jgi:hypothetical protein
VRILTAAVLAVLGLPTIAAAQQIGYGIIWSRLPGADHMRILAVAPGSPAAAAGLIEDDQVVAIRGKRVGTIPPGQEEQAAGPPTTPLTLRVRRGANESDASVTAAPVNQQALESRLRARFCSRGDCVSGAGKIAIPGMFDYDGTFSNGGFDGNGSITHPNGVTCTGTFTRGTLPRGRCTLPEGVVYDGELKDYTPAGTGSLISKNGLRVEGTWNGLRATGEVRGVYSDGWVYRGPFSSPNEPNRPNGSYYDAKGDKIGEAPLLDPHPPAPAAPVNISSRQLFENGKGDVIAKLKKDFPNAKILYEQHAEGETRYLTIPLGRPSPPASAKTVIIALMGDPRQVTEVGIVRPGSVNVMWGGNVVATAQGPADVFRTNDNTLYGQVRAKSGVTTANLYVIVMVQ